MKKRLLVLVGLMVTMLNATPVSACTPSLSVPSITIPEIKVELSDELKDATSNSAKDYVQKNIDLEYVKPTFKNYGKFINSNWGFFKFHNKE